VNLNYYCELIVDCEHKTAPIQSEGYPSIRTPNVGQGRFIIEGVNRVSQETYDEWTRRATPKDNDLILAREAPIGNVAIIKNGQKFCLGQRTVLLRPNKTIVNPDYLMYLIISPRIQGVIQGMANGVTVNHLNMEDIRDLELPKFPEMVNQTKIAGILSAYDELIDVNERRIKLLETIAKVIYEEWFVKFKIPGHETVKMVDSNLGAAPEGWRVETFGDIAQQVRKSVGAKEVSPETPYVGLEHIPRRSIALSNWGYAREVESTKLAFRKGDILFGKIRPYFHKVAVAPIDGICSSDTIVIRPVAPEYYSLVLLCASSQRFVANAAQTSQGTKMPRANWDVLAKYPVIVAPVPILSRFDRILKDIVSLILNIVYRNRTLSSTRNLLLPRLISGGIDVSDLDVSGVEMGA